MRWNVQNGRELVTLFLGTGLDLATSNADYKKWPPDLATCKWSLPCSEVATVSSFGLNLDFLQKLRIVKNQQ